MSTVIKAGQAGPVLKHLSTVDLADHLEEADVLVERARRHASQIAAKAGQDAERALQEANKTGYDAGYALGYSEGTAAGHQAAYEESIERFNKEHANIVAAMERAVAGFDALKEEIRIAAERDVLEFAVRVVSKLTFAIGRLHRESATENLSRTLRLVGSRTDLTIRVHPHDAESIKTFAQSVLQRVDATPSVNIVEDDSLSPGGCVVCNERTEIDATLETQVDEMVTLLLGGKAGND
jgi:flagellar assembly protein FliH